MKGDFSRIQGPQRQAILNLFPADVEIQMDQEGFKVKFVGLTLAEMRELGSFAWKLERGE